VPRHWFTRRTPVLPVLHLLVSLSAPGALAAQTIRGTVRDSLAGAPLGGVRVELIGPALGRVTASDPHGGFVFSGVPEGRYRLRLARVGYAVRVLDDVVPGAAPLVVRLTALGAPLDPVVVSASRREEAALDAPAAVTVVGRDALAASPALEPVGQVNRAPGVNAATKGLIQETFSARGGNTVNSGGLLLLHDWRYAAIPSIAFNVPYLVPVTGDDVDRIEVIRGPAAALYGPGAPTGVVHVLTRSPFDERGGSVTLTGGTRSVAAGGFRYAMGLGPTLAAKLSAEYFRGHDWEYADPEELENRDDAIAGGADPDTLRIARREPTVARALADARLDWRPALGTEVTLAAGAAEALDAVDQTPFGGVQGEHWRYSYAQLRARRNRLLAQALYDWSDAGDSYTLRDGKPVVDRSRVLVGQLQHGTTVGRADLRYGADGRWTDPRTDGTVNGINEDDDFVSEVGVYVHADLPLSPAVRAVGALRVDRHNRLHDLVVSPRVGLVFQPGPTHALRLTYNRAFTSPDANDLFLDREAWRIPIIGPYYFTGRGMGVPKDGFTFARDCGGGLCMRSQFNADPDAYLPLDVTVLWPALVTFADAALGVDLSGVPAPVAADVRTTLAAFDPDRQAFDPVDPADVTDVAGEGRSITNVVELGYRGVLSRRLAVSAEVWVNRVLNVPGRLEVITPNAFFDEGTLRDYLGNYLPADTAALVAATASQIPAGTVTPRESPYPNAVLVVTRRGGAYTLWGADLAATLDLLPGLALSASYSWTSNDTIPDVRDVGTFYLNVPRSRGTAGLSWRHPSGVTAAVAGRWVTAFRVNSGVYDGRVEDYVVADLTAGLPLPGWPAARLQLTAQNLVGGRHREMIGAPEIGRLVLARLRVGF
jgi:iron complex outermembrane receptor protein